MDFKERILTTFEHEEPDRVPVMSLMNEPMNVYQYRGKKGMSYFNLLKRPILKDIVMRFINLDWIFNRFFLKIYKEIIQVSIDMNFDAVWTQYMSFKLKKDKTFSLGFYWPDIWGRVWEIQLDKFGTPDPFYIRGHCNTEERWDEWVEAHASDFDNSVKHTAKFHEMIQDQFREKIYIFSFATPGVFENTWQPIGFEEFFRFMYEKPEFIDKVVEFQTNLFLRHLEVICKAGNEIIVCSDDMGHKTGPILSPKHFERFFGDSYRKIAQFVHKKGKKLVLHSCGNVYKLLEKYVEWGFDGLLTLEPTASMDLGKVRKIVGHDLVLIGNLDVSYLLVKGSRKEVEDAVKKAVRDAASGGGFILAPAHNHSAVDPTRLEWMVEAAHQFGNYPIQ